MTEYNIEFDETVLESVEVHWIEMLSTDGKWIGTYSPGGGWVDEEEDECKQYTDFMGKVCAKLKVRTFEFKGHPLALHSIRPNVELNTPTQEDKKEKE